MSDVDHRSRNGAPGTGRAGNFSKLTPLTIPVLVFLLLGIVTSISAGFVAFRNNQAIDRDLRIVGQQIALRLAEHVDNHIRLIDIVHMMLINQPGPNNAPFKARIRTVVRMFPSIEAIAWINADGILLSATPKERNNTAIGSNMFKHAGAGPALARAIESRKPTASPPLRLLLGGKGFTTYFPLYKDGKLQGFIAGVFTSEGLLGELLSSGGHDNYVLRIWDGDQPVLFYGADGFDGPDRARFEFPILDRTWTLGVSPTAKVLERRYDGIAEVLILGLALSAGIGVALRMFLLRRQALHESQALWRLIADRAPVPIFITRRADGRILYAPPSLDRMLGLPPGGAATRPITDFYKSPAERDRVLRILDSQGAVENLEVEVCSENVAPFPVLISVAKITFAGEAALLSAIADVRDRIRMERELVRAKEKAEFANRAKSDFLANISHELRTPLNAIIGFSKMMQDNIFGPLGARQYEDYVGDINHSGSHLLAIINDILDFSNIEAGKMALDEQDVDIGELIDWAVKLLAPRLQQAKMHLVTSVPNGLPALRADERLLRKAIVNILSNAVKFTAQGGRIEIAARRSDDGGLILSISDNGIGIPEDKLERVLEPFGQADSTLSRNHGGAGLGLAIAKSFIDMHQARLALVSTIGQGTRVTLEFGRERISEAKSMSSAT